MASISPGGPVAVHVQPVAKLAVVRTLAVLVFALFFIFGGITSLNDVLIPKLKGLFQLDYAEAMLTQFAFFTAYFVISFPAGLLVSRIGYLRTAAAGLVVMAVGCALFVPASRLGLFGMFLFALFVLASGITIVQVVVNPLISALGAPNTAHSRLTFAQAFNSLGTTVMPYIGSQLILGTVVTKDEARLTGVALHALRVREAAVVGNGYVGIAAVLVLVAAVLWHQRNRLPGIGEAQVGLLQALSLLKLPRFRFGVASIFLYVGAEVAIGSMLVSYLVQSSTLGLSELTAGHRVSLYWGGAMVGRFIGAWLLRMFPPGKVLAGAATIAGALVLLSLSTHGAVAGWSLLAVGLFNSIMFPTIFSLACEGLGERAPEGSGVICMAIVGGAIVPFITGSVADHTGLATALIVPIICYVGIAGFGWYARRPAQPALD